MNSHPPDTLDDTGAQWLSVADAAARLGVSVRAVQKRCALGKMAARRAVVAGGVRWEIEGRELRSEPDANPANLGREPHSQNGSFGSRPRSFDAQEAANLDANPRTDGREPMGANDGRELRELLAREREFSGFLKAQLEEANRNAAELRASLREALRAMPKQLPAPSSESPDLGARIEAGRAQNGEAGTYGHDALEARQIEANGAHSGEMSADELRALCFRVCRGP